MSLCQKCCCSWTRSLNFTSIDLFRKETNTFLCGASRIEVLQLLLKKTHIAGVLNGPYFFHLRTVQFHQQIVQSGPLNCAHVQDSIIKIKIDCSLIFPSATDGSLPLSKHKKELLQGPRVKQVLDF
jgi:hypothetical protein